MELQLSQIRFITGLYQNQFEAEDILQIWQKSSKKAFSPSAGCLTHDNVTLAIKAHSVGLTSREIASVLWTRSLQKPMITRVLSRTIRVSTFEFSEDVEYKLSQLGEVTHVRMEDGIYHIQMKTHSQAAEAVRL
ncbi:hypothetical protein G3M48_003381 [Beauveria asiatica]|uniref:Uncharacterized protein n=1 Tax=Beauveria asiatica TaxID=1069075 RepID=A0AAW0RVR7_9HYPO